MLPVRRIWTTACEGLRMVSMILLLQAHTTTLTTPYQRPWAYYIASCTAHAITTPTLAPALMVPFNFASFFPSNQVSKTTPQRASTSTITA
mmetsp:Transcript_11676/g.21121  ORF Transcript_11676/g.21121 Transcript_11676/m.21121 type:complete len:91 (+) Transcript_11676:1454-1726(+)